MARLHRNPAFKKKLELELTSGEELKFEVFDVDHMPETSDDLCFTLSLDTDEIYHRLFSHAGKREDAANAREEKESVLTLACALPSISSVSPSPPSSSSITLQCPLVPSKKFLQYHPNHGTLFPHLVLKFDFA